VTMTAETVYPERHDVDQSHSSTNFTKSGDTVMCNDEQITNWASLTEEADNVLTTSDRQSQRMAFNIASFNINGFGQGELLQSHLCNMYRTQV